MDFGITEVADETLATGIEKRLRVLRFRPCLEYLLVVKNDGAIGRWKVVALFLFLGLRFVYLPPILCFDFKTSDLMNLNTKDTRRIVLGWWRRNDEFVLAGLHTSQHCITNIRPSNIP